MSMTAILFLIASTNAIKFSTNNILNPEDYIEAVCMRHFTDKTILVINSDTEYSLPNFQHPKVTINSLDDLESVNFKINNYVVAFDSEETLNETLAVLKTHRHVWNSRGKFLVTTQNSTEKIDRILKLLWQYNIYNSLILLCNETCDFYSYDFVTSNCGVNITAEQREVSRVFEKKVSNNLCNLPFLVLWYPAPPFTIDYKKDKNPGLMFSALKIIGERNNLNVNFVDDYKKYLNEITYTKDGVVLEDFDSGKGDCFASVIAYDYRKCYIQYDCTASVGPEELFWVLPKPKELALWKGVVRSYSRTIWFLYLATTLVLVVLFWLFGVANGECFSASRWVLLVFRIMVCASENKPPRCLSVRILFINFSMFTIVMNTLYQGKLYALLNNPGYEKQLTTLSDILESELPLKFPYGYYALFMFNGNEGGEVLERFEPTKGSPNDTLYSAVINQDHGTIAREGDIKINPHLRSFFVSVNILYINVLIVVKRDHVLYDLVKYNVQRFSETGFYVKWLSDIELEYFKKPIVTQRIIKLSVKHLQGVFFIFVFGQLAAFVSFTVEVAVGKMLKT